MALRDLGYVEGKNITFEYRIAWRKISRCPALAEELVRSKSMSSTRPELPAL